MSRSPLLTAALTTALSAAALLGGCDNVNRSLVFFTNTNVGIEAGVDPTTSSGKVLIGYKRQEGVINPVYQPPKTKRTTTGDSVVTSEQEFESVDDVYRHEAYSVIAKIAGEARGRAGQGVGEAEASAGLAQWFATGQAAVELAKHPATAGAVVGSAEIAKAASGARVAPVFQGKLDINQQEQIGQILESVGEMAEGGDAAAARSMKALDAAVEPHMASFGLQPALRFDDGPPPVVSDRFVSPSAPGERGLLGVVVSYDAGLRQSEQAWAKCDKNESIPAANRTHAYSGALTDQQIKQVAKDITAARAQVTAVFEDPKVAEAFNGVVKTWVAKFVDAE